MEDTANYQIASSSWGGVGGQPQGGVSLGQPQGFNRGGTVGNQFSTAANSANILGEGQVRQSTTWKESASSETAGHNGGVATLPLQRTLQEDQGHHPLLLEGTGAGGEPKQPRSLDQPPVESEYDGVLSAVLGTAIQQAGLEEGYGGAVVQPGPSGLEDLAGLAPTMPQVQEGPQKDQCRGADPAKNTVRKRSSSPSIDRAKRAREEPLGEPEKPQRGGGHTGKPSREVHPLQREEPPKRSGGSRRTDESREVEARKRRTEDWARGQARPRARSQDLIVCVEHFVGGTQKTHESTGRSWREALPSHSRSRVRPRTRSRSEDRRRSSKSYRKKDIRRR